MFIRCFRIKCYPYSKFRAKIRIIFHMRKYARTLFVKKQHFSSFCRDMKVLCLGESEYFRNFALKLGYYVPMRGEDTLINQ